MHCDKPFSYVQTKARTGGRYLHVTFYSVSDGNGFGGVYFGTAKQMKEIESWNVPGWYGVE